MGSVNPFSKPKMPVVDTSAQQRAIAEQQRQLEEQRKSAEAEKAKLEQEKADSLTRLRTRLAGRRSLIATSELGVTEKLG